MALLLEVKELKTTFMTAGGLVRAVDGVSWDVEEGETVALVGESGCGKSVSALSIMRLVAPPAGRIESGQSERLVRVTGRITDARQFGDVIVANRQTPELADVADKVYSRDIFHVDE